MNQFTISCQQKLYAGVSAVHRENDTCDIAGLFASKKTSGSIQFSFFSDSCHGSMGFDVCFKILLCLWGHFGVNFSGHFCFKISRADGIYRRKRHGLQILARMKLRKNILNGDCKPCLREWNFLEGHFKEVAQNGGDSLLAERQMIFLYFGAATLNKQ